MQAMAGKTGDALMAGLVEMDEEFDKLAHEIGMSSMW